MAKFYTITFTLLSFSSRETPCLTHFLCSDGTALRNPRTHGIQTQVAGAAARDSLPTARAEGAKTALFWPKSGKNALKARFRCRDPLEKRCASRSVPAIPRRDRFLMAHPTVCFSGLGSVR